MVTVAQSIVARLKTLVGYRLMRDGMWVAAGHGIAVITGLVSIRLFTELAPQSVFGSANLILGMLTLGMNSLLAPITQTQLRYHSAYRDAGDGDAYTRVIFRFAAIAAGLTVLIAAIVFVFWPSARGGSGLGLVAWLAAWIAVSAIRSVLLNHVHADRRLRVFAAWLGCEALSIMAGTATVLWLWPTIEGYIAGQVLGTACPLVVFTGVFAWKSRTTRSIAGALSDVVIDSQFTASAWRQITTYGLPFVPFAMLGWVSNLSERYVLAANLDAAAVGQYVAAFAIASRLPSLVGGLMNDVLRPALFEAENCGDRAQAGRLFLLWLLVLSGSIAVLVLALYLMGDLVAGVLLAESYRENAAAIMVWIAAGYGCTVLAQALENRLLSLDASRVLIATKFVGALATVSFAMLLIPTFGVIGAAQANAAGHVTMLAGVFVAYKIVTLKLSQDL